MEIRILRNFVNVSLVVLALTGCGGGGSSDTGSAGQTISGTAAVGAAISNATLTVTGSAGGTVTTTTAADGTYSADVSTLTAPFLVKVDLGGGSILYSVGNATGTVNVHPLTDLIVRTWYEAQGTTADAAFGDPASAPPPGINEVSVISAVVKQIVQQWITEEGIDPSQFDLISTAFNANGSGFDAVLDQLTVNTSTFTLTVDVDGDATPEQTTDITIGSDGALSASTTVTTGGQSSSSFVSAVVPSSSAAQAALEGVLSALSGLAAIVNANGQSLVAADLSPIFDSNYMNRGFNATEEAANLASDFAGLTFTSFTVDRIVKFDAVNNVITIYGRAVVSVGGSSVEEIVDEEGEGLTFKRQGDGSWKLYGNQERARVHVRTLTEQRMLGTTCPSGCDGVYYALSIQVGAPVGVIQSATVTGNIGGTTQTVALTKKSGTFSGDGGVTEEHFDLEDGNGWWYRLNSPSEFPAAGSVYTVTVNYVGGGSDTFTKVLGASTAEAMTVQSGVETTVGHTFSSIQDTPVTLSWNLPVSFPIKEVYMYGYITDGTNGCQIDGPELSVSSTSGTITLPSTCNGNAVQINPGYPSISIVVTGTSGETTDIWYAFQ